VFAVGDDDQSIYAFRGANVGNMAAFEREFRVQHLIKLEQNYRSTSHILDTANHLIARNSKRLGKNLRTDAGHGEPVRIYEAMSDLQEAQWLVEEVQSLVGTGKLRGEIAILYRSNAQSRTIEAALFKEGIAYRVYGGLRFFERAEVKHALAYLRLMQNPHDDTAFMRVVNFPARGIGARSLEVLSDAAQARNLSLYAAVPHVDGKAGTSLANFTKLVEGMRFETAQLTLPEIVEHIVVRSGLRAHYESEKEGQDRIENLDELVNAATFFIGDEGFEQDRAAALAKDQPDADGVIEEPMSPLAAFLSHASLEAGDNQADAGQDAVQLMTVHAAKGLEFDAVFITGLEEGLFPHENAAQEPAGLEEERRLMYVAITRARERLYISYAQTRMLHGQTRYNLKSRFIEELPEQCLKWLTPRLGGMATQATQAYKAGWNNDWKKARSTGWETEAEYADKGSRRADVPDTGRGPVPGWARQQQAVQSGFRIGQNVRHAKFGEGVVVNLEGGGTDARAQINFGASGVKWLALAVAKLDPA
jgi:DNA helicase-2/ATP-dependent DNA helicase PcrA